MKKIIKKLAAWTALVGLMIGITACGKADAVKDDLYTYLNEMAEIQDLQKEAISEYNSYVTSEEADSQQLLTALNSSIIPKYESYLAELNAVTPATEDVQNVKAVCVDGANKQMDALRKVAEAITACDTDILNEADKLIVEAETIFADYESQLNVLANEHEITLTNGGSDAIQENNSEDGVEAE